MSGDEGRGVPAWALPTAVAALSGWAYILTLAPTVASSRDSAELALATIELGVAHPTGYPLYTLLGHAFVSALAFGDPGWRLNLFSALCGAGAIGLLADLLRRLTGSGPAAWLGALVFAFSPLVWQEANVTEVYALHLLLQVAILWSWRVWEESDDVRWLAVISFLVGLSLAHHLMTVLLLPCLGTAVVLRWRERRERQESWTATRALRLAGWLLLPLALYAYIPIVMATQPEICWTDLTTLESIFGHILGGGYAGSNLGIGEPAFWQKAVRYPLGLASQFGLALILVPLGIWSQRARPRELWPLAVGFAVSLLFALAYNVVDPDPFYLTSCLFVTIWIGAGAAWLCETTGRAPSWLRRTTRTLVVGLPALSGFIHFTANDRSDDFAIYDREMAALAVAERGAVFLTWGDNNFPLYLHRVHALRPDLDVIPLRLTILCNLPPELQAVRRRRDTLRGEGLAQTLEAVQTLGGRPRALVAAPVDVGSGWESFGLFAVEGGALTRLAPLRGERTPSDDVDRSAEAPRARDAHPTLLGVTPAVRDVAQGDVVYLRYAWKLSGRPPTGARVVTYLGDPAGAPALRPDGSPAFEVTHELGRDLPTHDRRLTGELGELLAHSIPYDVPSGDWTLWVRPIWDPGAVAVGMLHVRQADRVLWELPRIWRMP
ncbi:MAG: DUF2723 domain-containing protein [Deltaproteobacteria bacterium]|nr:DUF2723 domain-containing protein [Deltaproteobacteria bacterium]